jgi:hypothetical protein
MAKATPTTSRRRVLRLWAFEFVTTFFSLALMVAIGVTLIAYNSKPSPNWGPQINLNALLALLSTLLRAALVFLVSQVISQRKWHYFSDRAQPLHHLQQFDSASRGSLDALSLIPTCRGHSTGGVFSHRTLCSTSKSCGRVLLYDGWHQCHDTICTLRSS